MDTMTKANDSDVEHGIITEDSGIVFPGDLAYDYYNMQVVELIKVDDMPSGDPTKWADWRVVGTDKRVYLDGSRVCTIAYAKRRGFRGLDGF